MSRAFAKPITDLDIEEWVWEQYGFVPHPCWIGHCRELFLNGGEAAREDRRPWQECPVDKQAGIREAFVHFGLRPGQLRSRGG